MGSQSPFPIMHMDEIDLRKFVEAGDGIHVIRGSQDVRGWNGIRYAAGLSAKNVPAQQLSMNLARIPPCSEFYWVRTNSSMIGAPSLGQPQPSVIVLSITRTGCGVSKSSAKCTTPPRRTYVPVEICSHPPSEYTFTMPRGTRDPNRNPSRKTRRAQRPRLFHCRAHAVTSLPFNTRPALYAAKNSIMGQKTTDGRGGPATRLAAARPPLLGIN